MRKVITLVATYAAVLFLSPPVFTLFRMVGEQFIPSVVFQAHPWLYQVVTYTPLLLLLGAFLLATLKPVKEFGFFYTDKDQVLAVVFGVASAVVLYAIDVYEGFFVSSGIQSDPSALLAAGYLFSWALFAPFVEEFFFRGFVQTSLMHAMKSENAGWYAVGFTVFLEAVFHLSFSTSTLQLGYVVVFGFVASWLYLRTRSLVAPFLVHALGNGGELVLYWLLS